MAKRSLKASPAGIAIAKRAFERREWTQEYLASAVGLQTRQSIWKFFTGRPIERYLFVDICFQLDLDWEEIVDRPKLDDHNELAKPVDQTELKNSWETIYPSLQQQLLAKVQDLPLPLDTHQSAAFDALYVERSLHNIPQATSWLDITALEEQSTAPSQADFRGVPFLHQPPNSYEPIQIGTTQANQRPPVPLTQPSHTIEELLTGQTHLQICGPIGSGKSTLLQAATRYCLQHFTTEQVLPLRINLGQAAAHWEGFGIQQSPSSTNFDLSSQLRQSWHSEAITPEVWQWALQQGKVILILDDLDRMPENITETIQQQLVNLCQQFPQTKLIFASRSDRIRLNGLNCTISYLTTLSATEIHTYVKQWFAALTPNTDKLAQTFLTQLFDKRNQRLRHLASSPLLLHILCSVFRDCQLLPENRSRLYQHLLELHLRGWNSPHQSGAIASPAPLSANDLISLLSHLAYQEFQAGHQFFEANKVLALIMEYLGKSEAITPDANPAQTSELWQTANQVLHALTVHHGILHESARGIYSFSYLAFQEYLCARYIFSQTLNTDTTPQDLPQISPLLPVLAQKLHRSGWHTQQALYSLATHVLDPRWHEMILLTLDLLPDRDELIERLRRQVDRVILLNPHLKVFFHWLQEKVDSVEQSLAEPLNPAALRAFYCSHTLNLGIDLACSLEPSMTWQLPALLTRDAQRIQLLNWVNDLVNCNQSNNAIQICFSLQAQITRNPEIIELSKSLETLQQHLVDHTLDTWTTPERQAWAQRLRQAIGQAYDVGHDWNFSRMDWRQLETYYWGNVFLLECLQRYQPDAQHHLLKPRSVRPSSLAVMPNTTSQSIAH